MGFGRDKAEIVVMNTPAAYFIQSFPRKPTTPSPARNVPQPARRQGSGPIIRESPPQ
jgi:hypothetical protein